MSSQNQHTWDTAIDDFFDYAISTSSFGQPAVISPIGSVPQYTRPGPSRDGSSLTTTSNDSGFYSLSPSVPESPTVDTPHASQDNHIYENIQLVWAATEGDDFASSRTALPDQHHEKSCTRCSLTEAEARKCRLDRRREQNRESQRKFRARKEAKIREAAGQVAALETYVEFLEKHNNDLEVLNASLQQRIASFDSDKHLCTVDMSEPASQMDHVIDTESWRSRASAANNSTAAEIPKAFNAHDMHVSSSDELLLPYDVAADNYQILDLMERT